MVDTGFSIQHSRKLAFDQLLTDHTFHQFHYFDTERSVHRITSYNVWWHAQQGTLSFPDFWDLLMLQFFETSFPELAMSLFAWNISRYFLNFASMFYNFLFG